MIRKHGQQGHFILDLSFKSECVTDLQSKRTGKDSRFDFFCESLTNSLTIKRLEMIVDLF